MEHGFLRRQSPSILWISTIDDQSGLPEIILDVPVEGETQQSPVKLVMVENAVPWKFKLKTGVRIQNASCHKWTHDKSLRNRHKFQKDDQGDDGQEHDV